MKKINAYIGLDVHKETIAVAIAESGRDGEIRFYGNIVNEKSTIVRLVKKLTKKFSQVEFVYEAGPCGYAVYRLLTSLDQTCEVVAPSRIPKKPGDRIKNDHRDAMGLARLSRAGELTAVWVPDETHEAMRDLVRSRHAASRDLKTARLRILSFLLKYDYRYEAKNWTCRHKIWLANRQFDHQAQQIAFQHYLNAKDQALDRRTQIEEQIRELLTSWSLAPVVNALQALKGVALVIAVSVVTEVGDLTRFDNPKQLMAYLGLVPGEHSSGSKVRPRGITKTGNKSLRALLYEAAWSYRTRPKIGSWMLTHSPTVSQNIKDISWKAQLRLCKRYRKLVARGKKSQVAITAVARELVGFMWAITKEVHVNLHKT